MPPDIAPSGVGEEVQEIVRSTSDIMNLSGIKKIPAELYNHIIELWISKDPLSRAHILTMVSKQMRIQWGPALCRAVGPLRIDEHIDSQVLRFLGQEKNKSATTSLSIYYDSGINRSSEAMTELHQNLIQLIHIYERVENLRTLVVHPERGVDFYFQPHYRHLVMGLSNLRTLVVPSLKVDPDASPSPKVQSPLGAIVRTRHTSEKHVNTVFLRLLGCINTARQFILRPKYCIDQVSLFGYNDLPTEWIQAYEPLGIGSPINAREINLHSFTGSELRNLRLSENVVSLSICNPLDHDGNLGADVDQFFQGFIAQKQTGGNLDFHQLHLVSTVCFMKGQNSWISPWALRAMTRNMQNLSALSLHHHNLMSFGSWNWASGQWPKLKFFSVRESTPLIYTDTKDIANALPNLEGFGLDIPRFKLLHEAGEYTDDHRKMFMERGTEFWDALGSIHLKTLLVFVPRPKKAWNNEDNQQHAQLFEFALLDFLSSLEDESLQTVHFVLRDLGYSWHEEESNPRDEIVWSFRVHFESTTEPNGFVNAPEVGIERVTENEMTEEELYAFKALIGHQEMTIEQIEQKELGHLYYSPEKRKAIRKADAAKAKAELAKEAAGENKMHGKKRPAEAGAEGQAEKAKGC